MGYNLLFFGVINIHKLTTPKGERAHFLEKRILIAFARHSHAGSRITSAYKTVRQIKIQLSIHCLEVAHSATWEYSLLKQPQPTATTWLNSWPTLEQPWTRLPARSEHSHACAGRPASRPRNWLTSWATLALAGKRSPQDTSALPPPYAIYWLRSQPCNTKGPLLPVNKFSHQALLVAECTKASLCNIACTMVFWRPNALIIRL